jgi:lysozyme
VPLKFIDIFSEQIYVGREKKEVTMTRRLLVLLLLLRLLGDKAHADTSCKAPAEAVAAVSYWEQYRGRPYMDSGAQRLAIGFGYTTKVEPHWRWTEAHAKKILIRDLNRLAARICKAAPRKLTKGELASLVSLAYNIGYAGLVKGKLFKTLDGRRFPLYNRSNGKVLRGLTLRRLAEQKMWYNLK